MVFPGRRLATLCGPQPSECGGLPPPRATLGTACEVRVTHYILRREAVFPAREHMLGQRLAARTAPGYLGNAAFRRMRTYAGRRMSAESASCGSLQGRGAQLQWPCAGGKMAPPAGIEPAIRDRSSGAVGLSRCSRLLAGVSVPRLSAQVGSRCSCWGASAHVASTNGVRGSRSAISFRTCRCYGHRPTGAATALAPQVAEKYPWEPRRQVRAKSLAERLRTSFRERFEVSTVGTPGEARRSDNQRPPRMCPALG